jgi:hypothetical protein
MAQTFDIPVSGSTFSLAFPPRCVNCGQPATAHANFKFTRPDNASRDLPKEIALAVPQCALCRARSERTDYLMWIAFFVGGLLAAVAAWFGLALAWGWAEAFLVGAGGLSPSTEQTASTVIILAALLAGVPGGLLLEAVVRPLFLPCFPFFGISILYAPLLAVQLLGGVEYTAGLRGSMSRDFSALRLKFYNDDVARDFAVLTGHTPRP